ncbi:UNVERIFIED_CONTAM: hypothetical protein ABID98_001522 [Brevibacillus sp. OAP136]
MSLSCIALKFGSAYTIDVNALTNLSLNDYNTLKIQSYLTPVQEVWDISRRGFSSSNGSRSCLPVHKGEIRW